MRGGGGIAADAPSVFLQSRCIPSPGLSLDPEMDWEGRGRRAFWWPQSLLVATWGSILVLAGLVFPLSSRRDRERDFYLFTLCCISCLQHRSLKKSMERMSDRFQTWPTLSGCALHGENEDANSHPHPPSLTGIQAGHPISAFPPLLPACADAGA